MARASIWNKFNRDDDFVAVRYLLVNGKPIAPGQPIDKAAFTTRRLRCMFEWRRIRKADAVVKETVAPAIMLGTVLDSSDKPIPDAVLRERFGESYQSVADAAKPAPRKRGRPKRAAS